MRKFLFLANAHLLLITLTGPGRMLDAPSLKLTKTRSQFNPALAARNNKKLNKGCRPNRRGHRHN